LSNRGAAVEGLELKRAIVFQHSYSKLPLGRKRQTHGHGRDVLVAEHRGEARQRSGAQSAVAFIPTN
jgi:hypothetical protein